MPFSATIGSKANEGLKLTTFGVADTAIPMSKEDERSALLARRAQQGDYDDGREAHIPSWQAS